MSDAREIDLSDVEQVPYHLRLDEPPLAVCDTCGRKSWDADSIDRRCGLSQPSGGRCSGPSRAA